MKFWYPLSMGVRPKIKQLFKRYEAFDHCKAWLIASTTNQFFCSVYLIFPCRYISQWTNYRKSEGFLLWQQHGQMWCWSCNIFFYCISRSANNQTQEFNWWEYRSRFSYVDLLRPFSSKSNRQMNVLRTDCFARHFHITLVYCPKISGL